ncbi:MAG: hypothetical protein J6S40_02100, partial [Thermoguttaceae bacterium]|nr:hypothetical protein [Thermoguttaceae bacterium]
MKSHFKTRKLRLESLEERALLAVTSAVFEQAAELAAPTSSASWVVNTTDDPADWDSTDDILSLREAIAAAKTGDTITFDTSLAGKTITLAGTELEISNGITIDASSAVGITINANQKSRVFHINISDEGADNTVKLVSLKITGGNTDEEGGGIWNENAELTIVNSVIYGNVAEMSGGGIESSSSLTIVNSVIYGNVAEVSGGGIESSSSLTVINSTISGNSASGEDSSGGGINSLGDVTLTNTIVSFNYAVDHNNVYTPGNSPVRTNSIVNDNDNGGSDEYIDPGFVVKPVFEAGVLTNAESLDLSLRTGSDAINAGTNGAVQTDTDIAGNPRIADGIVDIGAYEYRKTNETPSTVVTTEQDIVDATDHLISLREAISYAAVGETVTFDASLAGKTIMLAGTELEITRGITIDASSAVGITINANQKSRVFSITGGNETNPVKLVSLTVTGGNAGVNSENSRGGGIYNSGGSLEIVGSTITGNFSDENGGGIYSRDATLVITNSTVKGNSTNQGVGGGICTDEGSLTIIGSTITANSSEQNYGGGICNLGAMTITDSKVTENIAKGGGGIYAAGTTTITNSTISGNSSTYVEEYEGETKEYGEGGGIYSEDTLSITNSVISGNSAGREGGGIYGLGELSITNSVISGNSAGLYGGGVIDYGALTLINTTVSGNYLTGEDSYGGGIFHDDYVGHTEPTIVNSIISLNHAAGFGYHDICDNSYSSAWLLSTNNIIGLDPGFAVSPIFDDSGKLVNPDKLDLSLTASSYAIDHGMNDAVETETDLVGNKRIFAAWKETPTVDIGAYEYQQHVEKGNIETPSTVVTTLLDVLDETDGLISLREAISYAEAGDTVTFDETLADKTITLNGRELFIVKNLTIDASNVGRITIDGNGKSRVFSIGTFIGLTDVTVGLIGLTISGGNADYGGGIHNSGTLNLTDVTISGNSAYIGGGIYNYTILNITNSKISGNSAYGDAGGIENYQGTVTITNSVISGNSAKDCAGGIDNYVNHGDSSTLTIINSTISGNYVTGEEGEGGGIVNNSLLTLTNAIVSLNYASSDSNIHNYPEDASVPTYSGSNDLVDTDPGFVVAPIFESGRLSNADTLDLSLAKGSAAINAGTNDAVQTDTDIAGNPRIAGGTVDIGAYESSYASFTFSDEKVTYDGNPHKLTVSGLETTDKVTYDYKGTSTTVSPSFSNAGIYEVTATVSRDNTNIWTGSATLTIEKAPITDVTFDNQTIGYDGKAHTFKVNGAKTADKVTYQYNGKTYTSAPSFTQKGDYEVTATVTRANYADWTKTAVMTIQEGIITDVSFNDQKVGYDGKAHTFKVSGAKSTDKVTYQYNGKTYSSAPSFTQKGDYEVTATVSRANCEDWSKTAVMTIQEGIITGISFKDQKYVYSGANRTLTLTGKKSSDKVTYEYDGKEYSSCPKFTEAGTYVVTATVSRANYEDWVGSATLTIEEKPIYGLSFNNLTYTYNGKERSLKLYGTRSSDSVTYEYNGETFDSSPTFTEAGVYNVTVTVSRDNCKDWTKTARLKIKGKALTGVYFAGKALKYDTEYHSISVSGLKSGDTVTYTYNGQTYDECPEFADAGTYKIKARVSRENCKDWTGTAYLTITKTTLKDLNYTNQKVVYD